MQMANETLAEATSALPELGSNVGGFLDALSGPLAKWILLFVVVAGVGAIFSGIFLYIKKTASGMGAR